MTLTLLQVFGSSFYGPLNKGILPNIRSLLPVSNFKNMINPTQMVRTVHTVTYSVPSTFHRLRFKKYA